MKIHLQKVGLALFACDTEGEDWMIAASEGFYRVEKVSERSYQQLSMAQKMIDITFQNQEQFKSREALRDALSIEAGHTELREKLNGERYLVARSWSYSKAKHEEFNQLVDRVRAIIEAQWGFDPLGER